MTNKPEPDGYGWHNPRPISIWSKIKRFFCDVWNLMYK